MVNERDIVEDGFNGIPPSSISPSLENQPQFQSQLATPQFQSHSPFMNSSYEVGSSSSGGVSGNENCVGGDDADKGKSPIELEPEETSRPSETDRGSGNGWIITAANPRFGTLGTLTALEGVALVGDRFLVAGGRQMGFQTIVLSSETRSHIRMLAAGLERDGGTGYGNGWIINATSPRFGTIPVLEGVALVADRFLVSGGLNMGFETSVLPSDIRSLVRMLALRPRAPESDPVFPILDLYCPHITRPVAVLLAEEVGLQVPNVGPSPALAPSQSNTTTGI